MKDTGAALLLEHLDLLWIFAGGPPLLPGDKSSRCNGLAMADKFGQTKDLSLNLGKQKGYELNAKPPALAEGFS